MSLSAPDGRGRMYVEVGDAWHLLSRISDFAVTDEQPETTQPDDALDDSVGAGAASVGDPRPGQVTFTLDQPDAAGPAALAWVDAYQSKEDIKFRAVLGAYKEEGVQATGGTTIAISKADGEITIASGAGGNVNIPATFGTGDTTPGPFWRRGQVIEQGTNAYHLGPWLTATTRMVTLLGPIASGIVTRATAAQQAADWSVSPASDDYTVHRYRLMLTGEGRVLAGGDITANSTGTQVSGTMQPNDFLTRQFLLKVAP